MIKYRVHFISWHVFIFSLHFDFIEQKRKHRFQSTTHYITIYYWLDDVFFSDFFFYFLTFLSLSISFPLSFTSSRMEEIWSLFVSVRLNGTQAQWFRNVLSTTPLWSVFFPIFCFVYVSHIYHDFFLGWIRRRNFSVVGKWENLFCAWLLRLLLLSLFLYDRMQFVLCNAWQITR